MHVRQTVMQLRDVLNSITFDEDTVSTAELVTAEALNNITEHAYAGVETGQIELAAHVDPMSLYINLVDSGLPMPGACLPPHTLPRTTDVTHELPEGGFGWSLIRHLCDDVQYRRCDQRNHLLIRIARQNTQTKHT